MATEQEALKFFQEVLHHEPGVARRMLADLNVFIAEKKHPAPGGRVRSIADYPSSWLGSLAVEAQMVSRYRAAELVREGWPLETPDEHVEVLAQGHWELPVS